MRSYRLGSGEGLVETGRGLGKDRLMRDEWYRNMFTAYVHDDACILAEG